MQKVTATGLARNLRAVLDRVRESGETYIVERGGQPVVRLSPTPGEQSAEQALATWALSHSRTRRGWHPVALEPIFVKYLRFRLLASALHRSPSSIEKTGSAFTAGEGQRRAEFVVAIMAGTPLASEPNNDQS